MTTYDNHTYDKWVARKAWGDTGDQLGWTVAREKSGAIWLNNPTSNINARYIADLLNQKEAAVYEAAVLLGEAVRRPLWGSLQGDWVERANAWNKKYDVALVQPQESAR